MMKRGREREKERVGGWTVCVVVVTWVALSEGNQCR